MKEQLVLDELEDLTEDKLSEDSGKQVYNQKISKNVTII